MKRRVQFRVHAMEAQRGNRGRATFTVNLLKPSGFFTYNQVEYSKILHGAHIALSVLYGSQNRQRLLLYTYEGWNFNSGNYLFTTDTK